MNNEIKVYPEILKVQLAYDNGWQEVVGHKVVIQGIELSFVICREDNLSVIVSTLDGGCRITTIPISPLLALFCADKETTLKMLKDKAEIVSQIIDANGKDYILELAKKRKRNTKLNSDKCHLLNYMI